MCTEILDSNTEQATGTVSDRHSSVEGDKYFAGDDIAGEGFVAVRIVAVEEEGRSPAAEDWHNLVAGGKDFLVEHIEAEVDIAVEALGSAGHRRNSLCWSL